MVLLSFVRKSGFYFYIVIDVSSPGILFNSLGLTYVVILSDRPSAESYEGSFVDRHTFRHDLRNLQVSRFEHVSTITFDLLLLLLLLPGTLVFCATCRGKIWIRSVRIYTI